MNWPVILMLLLMVSTALGSNSDSKQNETEGVDDEVAVKAAVEHFVFLEVCSDLGVLGLLDMDYESCSEQLDIIRSFCWHDFDGFAKDYRKIAEDNDKEMFLSLSNAFAYCVRGHLLLQLEAASEDGAHEATPEGHSERD